MITIGIKEIFSNLFNLIPIVKKLTFKTRERYA